MKQGLKTKLASFLLGLSLIFGVATVSNNKTSLSAKAETELERYTVCETIDSIGGGGNFLIGYNSAKTKKQLIPMMTKGLKDKTVNVNVFHINEDIPRTDGSTGAIAVTNDLDDSDYLFQLVSESETDNTLYSIKYENLYIGFCKSTKSNTNLMVLNRASSNVDNNDPKFSTFRLAKDESTSGYNSAFTFELLNDIMPETNNHFLKYSTSSGGIFGLYSNSNNITLFKKNYFVHYESNLGSDILMDVDVPSSSYTYDGVSRVIPATNNKDFLGWNTLPDGSGKTYHAGDEIEYGQDLTLYAIWRTSNFNVDSSQMANASINVSSVKNGDTLEASILIEANYKISNVKVTMGGEIIENAYDSINNKIVVENVCGDIVISCDSSLSFDGSTYRLVTSDDELFTGDIVILAAEKDGSVYSLSSFSGTGSSAKAVTGTQENTSDDRTIIFGSSAIEFNLEKETIDDRIIYHFEQNNNYLRSYSSSSNTYIAKKETDFKNESYSLKLEKNGLAVIENTVSKILAVSGSNIGHYAESTNNDYVSMYVKTPSIHDAVDSFVNNDLKMSSISSEDHSSGTGCLGDNGYYQLAKDALASLNENQKACFFQENQYSDARERLNAWANANNEFISFENKNLVISKKSNLLTLFNEDISAFNYDSVIVICLLFIGSLSLVCLITNKRRKIN